ncbi:MAG: helix-turn-helix transcriptional regulator [Clostridiales bacterium]|nr:helix-turn-helix transcriptional regulator [Clostridiales bacterium]
MNYPTINAVATGRNITRLRMQRGMSVRELQLAMGFATPQAIYKWQQGLSLPTVDNLVILSAILRVPIDSILVVDT